MFVVAVRNDELAARRARRREMVRLCGRDSSSEEWRGIRAYMKLLACGARTLRSSICPRTFEYEVVEIPEVARLPGAEAGHVKWFDPAERLGSPRRPGGRPVKGWVEVLQQRPILRLHRTWRRSDRRPRSPRRTTANDQCTTGDLWLYARAPPTRSAHRSNLLVLFHSETLPGSIAHRCRFATITKFTAACYAPRTPGDYSSTSTRMRRASWQQVVVLEDDGSIPDDGAGAPAAREVVGIRQRRCRSRFLSVTGRVLGRCDGRPRAAAPSRSATGAAIDAAEVDFDRFRFTAAPRLWLYPA